MNSTKGYDEMYKKKRKICTFGDIILILCIVITVMYWISIIIIFIVFIKIHMMQNPRSGTFEYWNIKGEEVTRGKTLLVFSLDIISFCLSNDNCFVLDPK